MGVLVGVAAITLLAGCESRGTEVNREAALGVGTVRDCLRAVGSFPEETPLTIQGPPKLNALVRSAQRGRGAVRTPPPDPTHAGSVVAYFLLFDDGASAQRAKAVGPEAVREFRARFRGSVSSNEGYQMTEVQRNVLVLYLEDPFRAEGQKEGIDDCLRDPPR